MFLPSVIGGATYEAFITAIEHNRLFRLSQRQFLTECHQNSDINMFKHEGGDNLLILGTIEHSLELEQALGSGIYLLFNKRPRRNLPKHMPEVIVNVNCKEEQSDLIMKIMWKYNAITVGKTSVQ